MGVEDRAVVQQIVAGIEKNSNVKLERISYEKFNTIQSLDNRETETK